MISILLVDPNKDQREKIKRLIMAEPDIRVVGEAEDGQSAILLFSSLRPDIVSTELLLPDMTAPELMVALSKIEYIELRIIIISNNENDLYYSQAVTTGAIAGLEITGRRSHDSLNHSVC